MTQLFEYRLIFETALGYGWLVCTWRFISLAYHIGMRLTAKDDK